MGTVIAITSGKGGTGKTTVTAAISSRLAKLNRRVLCIDMDCAMRNLDIALGLSDRALMNFVDVIEGNCSLEHAAIPHPTVPGLFFLSAPAYAPAEHITENQMRRLTAQAAGLFDFVLLDSPAGLGHSWRLAVCGAEQILVVSNTDPFSLRDAERVTAELASTTAELRLIVNRVQPKLLKKLAFTIDDAIDQIGLPLLGIIPEDSSLQLTVSQSKFPSFAERTRAGTACRNIALRLIGKSVPLCRI